MHDDKKRPLRKYRRSPGRRTADKIAAGTKLALVVVAAILTVYSAGIGALIQGHAAWQEYQLQLRSDMRPPPAPVNK